jgi:hypothetical protein
MEKRRRQVLWTSLNHRCQSDGDISSNGQRPGAIFIRNNCFRSDRRQSSLPAGPHDSFPAVSGVGYIHQLKEPMLPLFVVQKTGQRRNSPRPRCAPSSRKCQVFDAKSIHVGSCCCNRLMASSRVINSLYQSWAFAFTFLPRRDPFLPELTRRSKRPPEQGKRLTGSRSTPQFRESALPQVTAHRSLPASRFAFVRG